MDEDEAKATVRSWLRAAWAPATHGLLSDQDTIEFAYPYDVWLPLVDALKVLSGDEPEPERHYGTFRVIDGGGLYGADQ